MPCSFPGKRSHEGEPVEVSLPGSELEHIPEAECLEILARNRLGRIAFFAGGQQEIFPVNYALKADTVVLRSAPGTKLSGAPGAQGTFEIDEYDPETGIGWSVVVHGEAQDVTDAGDDFSCAARGAHVTPLAPGEKPTVWPSSGRPFRGAAPAGRSQSTSSTEALSSPRAPAPGVAAAYQRRSSWYSGCVELGGRLLGHKLKLQDRLLNFASRTNRGLIASVPSFCQDEGPGPSLPSSSGDHASDCRP